MRVLVVGAGASYAESVALDAPNDLRMPLMKNFARLLWRDFHPGRSLVDFLRSKDVNCTIYDALEEFVRREEVGDPEINIEAYFEFFWNKRHEYQTEYGLEWWNVLYHGLLRPLLDRMLFVFNDGGLEWKPFPVSDKVANSLQAGDLVLNLNYDTVFDIAVERTFPNNTCYLPNKVSEGGIIVAKPHGSLNLLVDRNGFAFGSAKNTGALPPKDSGFHYGFLPPRINKQYAQHEIAEQIVASIPHLEPTTLTFWGVGLTASDVDLVALYALWAQSADNVEAINPSKVDVERISTYLGTSVTRFESVDRWIEHGN